MSDYWQRLGIDPTTDIAKIRQAYASALKQIDVDASPQAFVGLRSAYDGALAQAHAITKGQSTHPVDVGSGDLADPTQAQNDSGQPAIADTQNSLSLIFSLLETSATQDIAHPALAHATQRYVDDLHDRNIDAIRVAEDRLINIILGWRPYSDPMIEPAAAFFRWADQPEEPTAHSMQTGAILQRLADLPELAALRRPDHPHHDAFSVLCQRREAALDYHDLTQMGHAVGRLLDHIRAYHPSIEFNLDPHHVALWDRKYLEIGQYGLLPVERVHERMIAAGHGDHMTEAALRNALANDRRGCLRQIAIVVVALLCIVTIMVAATVLSLQIDGRP